MPVPISRRRFFQNSLIAAGTAMVATISPRSASASSGTSLATQDDFSLSPFTGYTRQHWLEITEKLLAGILPHLDPSSGLPNLKPPKGDEAHYALYAGDQHVGRMQAMERIMVLAVLYTAATNRDTIRGYDGSITEPFLRALTHISSPDDPLYCRRAGADAFIGSETALAILISPRYFWDPLTRLQKRNVLTFLRDLAYMQAWDNNHHLFHMVPVPVLEANNITVDRKHHDAMSERILGWHRGDGWFIDGSGQKFDWYNAWGYHLYGNILCRYDASWRDRFGDRFKRLSSRFFDSYPLFFGRDGSPVPWGRSLAYRFACLAPIGWARLNGACPLPAGQARRIASGCLKYFYENGCLDPNGVLSLGYLGANAAVAENYLTHGTNYFSAQGLSCLLLPEDDAFWTSPGQPMPADEQGGERVLRGPQMVIRASARDGQSRIYPVGQQFGHEKWNDCWQLGAKYFQHAYATSLGFCLSGAYGEELGAGRTGFSLDGRNWAYRERPYPILLESNHVASVYEMDFHSATDADSRSSLNEFGRIITHTLIGDAGEVHVFWHNSTRPVYLHVGGYGIRVVNRSQLKIDEMEESVTLQSGTIQSALRIFKAPAGSLEVEVLQARNGWRHSHLHGGQGAFPYWHSENPIPPGVAVVVHADASQGRPLLDVSINISELPELIVVRYEDTEHKIHFPFPL